MKKACQRNIEINLEERVKIVLTSLKVKGKEIIALAGLEGYE